MKVAFVGAGQMGMPMVERLVGAGHDVMVMARRAEVRDQCVAAGASATADPAEALRGRGVVVLCLFSDEQIQELVLGPSGLLELADEGTLFVSHVTGSPATVRAMADAGAARGIRAVDAPVSGSAEDIAEGHVTVLLGGAEADVEVAEQVVAAYGDPVLRMGPLGSAHVVKLLNNAIFSAQVQLAGDLERIAEAFGVDVRSAAAAIQRSSGSSFVMGLIEAMGSARTLAAAVGEYLAKDVEVVKAVAAELGIELGAIGAAIESGPLTFEKRSS